MKPLTLLNIYLVLALWIKQTKAQLDCLEGTDLESEFCKLYNDHKQVVENNSNAPCVILNRISIEHCGNNKLTTTIPSIPPHTTPFSTTEREYSEKTHTQLPTTSTDDVDYTTDTTHSDGTVRPYVNDCNATTPSGNRNTLQLGVHTVAIFSATTLVLLIALIIETIVLVCTCWKRRTTHARKWSFKIPNTALQQAEPDSLRQSLSQDTPNSPSQIQSFYFTSGYSSLGPTYSRQLQPIAEEDEHTYDIVSRENSLTNRSLPDLPYETQEIQDNNVMPETQVQIHHEIRNTSRAYVDGCTAVFLEENCMENSLEDIQPNYTTLESIQEEPELEESSDESEESQPAYHVLETSGDNSRGSNRERVSVNDEGKQVEENLHVHWGDKGGEYDAGTATPEEYECPIPVRSKFDIHVHVSACTH